MDWETVYGAVNVYKTKHLVTYGGGHEGGYVYFWKEGDPGVVPLAPDTVPLPTYSEILTGQVATKFEEGGDEYIGVPPDNLESLRLPDSGENSVISDDMMREATQKS